MIKTRTGLLVAALLATSATPLVAQTIEVSAANQRTQHRAGPNYSHAEIRVHGPAGYRYEQRVAAPQGFFLNTAGLADGEYRYSIQFSSPQRTNGASDDASPDGDGRRVGVHPGAAAPDPVDGSFVVDGGQVHLSPGREQETREDAPKQKSSSPIAKDQVIPDDLIVQQSLCVGFDCVNNESFGFDTIRLKENNTRIKFEDTSANTFPTNDWQLTANDSASGGASKFSIEDITGARVPFTLTAGAASNAIFVDSTGRVGFRTSTPVLDLHVNTSNTPALRLEQNDSGGFTAQTWDIGANEANFFVRDVTGGSRLSFRIRPGAPTSSIDIAADGDVGIGTASPESKLDIELSADASAPITALRLANIAHDDPERFVVDSSGNVFARGSITQLSSRDAKTDFASPDVDEVLKRVADLPISTWRYKDAASDDRHLGPVAQDFHAAFGLGRDAESVAPTDLAGVALAAIQALNAQLAERDARIEALMRRVEALERSGPAEH